MAEWDVLASINVRMPDLPPFGELFLLWIGTLIRTLLPILTLTITLTIALALTLTLTE